MTATPGTPHLNGEAASLMHSQHQQPAGDGLDQQNAAALLTTVQRRSRNAATAARWAERWAERTAEYQEELAKSIEERAELHAEIALLRRLTAKRAGIDPTIPPPPQHYLEALRSAQWEPYREVVVDIDDQPWKIGFGPHEAAPPDPERELAMWAQFVAAVRKVRAALAVTA